jgi:nicotinamidase-related amidase
LTTLEGSKLPVEHCIEGTAGWELYPEIDTLAKQYECITFKKPTFGAKELAEYLADVNSTESIERIDIIGLCTDICVISNALLIKAFLPDAPIYVDSSCCAGVTPESHENALAAMKMCQINVY